MTELVRPVDRPGRRKALWWFVASEVVCIGGFATLLGIGSMRLALFFLVGPFQILAWFVALRGSTYALALFAALLPSVGLELLPVPYVRYVYLPVTILLLLVVTRDFLIGDEGLRRARLAIHDKIPLALLGLSLALSTLSAVANGWTRPDFWHQVVLFAEAMVLLYLFAVAPITVAGVRAVILAFSLTLSAGVLVSWLVPGVSGSEAVLGGITSKGGLNVLGTFLSCGAALLLGVFLQTDRASTRIAALLCMVVVLSTLVLTRSRGAWFGFGVAAVYALLRVRSGWLWTVLVFAAFLLLGVGPLRAVLLSRVGDTSEGDPSFLGRLLLWYYGWMVFKANWLLGVGFDNFRYVKHFYGYPGQVWWIIRFHTHNIFLEMLADLGIVGFLGFCWLYVRTWFRLDRVVRTRLPDHWALALGLGAALVAYAAHGLFDFVAFHHGALPLLAVLLGLGISLSRLSASGPARPANNV
ncbi:O-antigen ligase family protein [candidate division WOR-3 bacterium]|nr:O-antigen ligase family protein [candidate division WOR-3 bacterium]